MESPSRLSLESTTRSLTNPQYGHFIGPNPGSNLPGRPCPGYSGTVCTQVLTSEYVRQLIGNAGQANYAASKAGLIGLTKSSAKEFAARNITVNAVAPGYVETDMTAGLSDDQKAAFLNIIPLKRGCKPEEIAGVVTFLASPTAAYLTGQVVSVDGGMTML